MKTILGKIDSLVARLRAARAAFHGADVAADRAALEASGVKREMLLRCEALREQTRAVEAEGALLNVEFAFMAWGRKRGRLDEVLVILDDERLRRHTPPVPGQVRHAFALGQVES